MVRPLMQLVCLLIAFLSLDWSRANAAFATLENSNLVYVRPLTGLATYAITGTISFDAGYTIQGGQVITTAFNEAGDGLLPDYGVFDLTKALNGGTFTGVLMTVTISSNTPYGHYDHTYMGTTTPYYYATALSASGQQETEVANFTISILAASVPSIVPEPSSLILWGIAGIIGGRFLLVHRRRKAG